jgi:hypothetical protein
MENQINFYYEFLIKKMREGDSYFGGMDTNQIAELLELNPTNKPL